MIMQLFPASMERGMYLAFCEMETMSDVFGRQGQPVAVYENAPIIERQRIQKGMQRSSSLTIG
jgi:hypothetical protein